MNTPTPATALQVINEDFGTKEALAVSETASSGIAAQAKAMVESRYIMAMRNPRRWDQVRIDLMKECNRPSFANNKSAFYVKPIGNGVEGLGIRFVEVALRCMKNVMVETTMIFEDAEKEVQRVTVTDLEANLTYPLDVRVSKTVERAKPMDDGSFISVRKNSYGKAVYTVPANDDDLLNKRGALISKAIRVLGLRIIPGDLQDEAEGIIKTIRLNEVTKDPDAERKAIADYFASIGVNPDDLNDLLGHDLSRCSPPEMVMLRGIYGAIRDGEATWNTVMENKEKYHPAAKDKTKRGNKEGLPECSKEEFEELSKEWMPLARSGKKKAKQIIATASTSMILTDEQQMQIDAWEKEGK